MVLRSSGVLPENAYKGINAWILHIALLVSNLMLVTRARFYRVFLVLQLIDFALAAAGKLRLPIPGARLAYYYYVVTKATVAALEAAGLRPEVKVMVGGAAVSQTSADEIGADGYARDSTLAVVKAKQLVAAAAKAEAARS